MAAIMARMLQKAELHLHLEGSVEAETLRELDPSLTIDQIAAATSYTDFTGFIESYVWVNRLLRSPGDYAIAARRLFDRLASEEVTYARSPISAGIISGSSREFAPIYNALQREAVRAKLGVRWILDATRQFGAEAAKPYSTSRRNG